ASKEIAAAKKIAPDRPEAYFNEAILVQEYGARGAPPTETLATLAKAKALYEQFLAKADGASFADSRERAKERLRDLEAMSEV
ncbi:hypothetical protein NL526_29415, partial [Klebsiella pneumoniae]|nr:hypothetical protein [Klebsiella pneumoniae]